MLLLNNKNNKNSLGVVKVNFGGFCCYGNCCFAVCDSGDDVGFVHVLCSTCNCDFVSNLNKGESPNVSSKKNTG
jgi:hypothetical protein